MRYDYFMAFFNLAGCSSIFFLGTQIEFGTETWTFALSCVDKNSTSSRQTWDLAWSSSNSQARNWLDSSSLWRKIWSTVSCRFSSRNDSSKALLFGWWRLLSDGSFIDHVTINFILFHWVVQELYCFIESYRNWYWSWPRNSNWRGPYYKQRIDSSSGGRYRMRHLS